VIPGEYLLADDDVVANPGRATVELVVANTGDRPIQVGSHFHFFEANKALRFERARAFGMRLNVPAGPRCASSRRREARHARGARRGTRGVRPERPERRPSRTRQLDAALARARARGFLERP
jgi:urease beta subunit